MMRKLSEASSTCIAHSIAEPFVIGKRSVRSTGTARRAARVQRLSLATAAVRPIHRRTLRTQVLDHTMERLGASFEDQPLMLTERAIHSKDSRPRRV